MIRSSSHTLMFANQKKIEWLNKLFDDYRQQLEYYIRLILTKKLPLKKLLSSKELPDYKLSHSHYKQICYKQASEIIRSNVKYIRDKVFRRYRKVYKYFIEKGRQVEFTNKKFSELNINYMGRVRINTSDSMPITLDSRRFSCQKTNGGEFDEFIKIGLPYFIKQNLAKTINLPIKYHKQSNKFKDWTRLNSIKISKKGKEYYVVLFYEKPEVAKKDNGSNMGLDIGYKKLMATSDGKFFGNKISELCESIARKEKKSKNQKQAIETKKNYINQICNQLDLNEVKNLYVEDLVQVKNKSKFSRRFNNKIQYWSYKQVLEKLLMRSEEEGFLIRKVNSAYTSQICSSCGEIHKESRKGESYECITCGMIMDADYNASMNILHRGEEMDSFQYSPSNNRNVFP